MKDRIRSRLFELQDLNYREFHSALMPTVQRERVIGVRVPELRALAKELHREKEIKEFLSDVPHKYYEENNLHAFIIEGIKDYNECIFEVNRFLPSVDNWATCDMMRPKVFAAHKKELLCEIERWIAADGEYTVRFGIEMLMVHYLDEDFEERFLEMVAGVKREEYYVRMMVAWYFATALAKRYDEAVKYIEERRLDEWTHQKAIQKAADSRRIPETRKKILKSLG